MKFSEVPLTTLLYCRYPRSHELEVRALRAVTAGTELTTQYVSPERSTSARRKMLRNKWFFWCAC